jgi:hypothetical protein
MEKAAERVKASRAAVDAVAKAATAVMVAMANAAVDAAVSVATESVKAENAASRAKVKPKYAAKRKSGSLAKRVRDANHGNRAKAAPRAMASAVVAADVAIRKCARTPLKPWKALRWRVWPQRRKHWLVSLAQRHPNARRADAVSAAIARTATTVAIETIAMQMRRVIEAPMRRTTPSPMAASRALRAASAARVADVATSGRPVVNAVSGVRAAVNGDRKTALALARTRLKEQTLN